MVVLAIIGMVTAMTIPMMLQFMRTRKIRTASEIVKYTCLLARGKAIQQKRMFCVTLLDAERAVVINDYEKLRLAVGFDEDDQTPFCPHYLGNYLGADEEAQANNRFDTLTGQSMERVRYLPEGCRFDFGGATVYRPGWTYIFLPAGGAWTLQPDAVNARNNAQWRETTLMDGNQPTGLRIYGPNDRDAVTLVVYAMTGQARIE